MYIFTVKSHKFLSPEKLAFFLAKTEEKKKKKKKSFFLQNSAKCMQALQDKKSVWIKKSCIREKPNLSTVADRGTKIFVSAGVKKGPITVFSAKKKKNSPPAVVVVVAIVAANAASQGLLSNNKKKSPPQKIPTKQNYSETLVFYLI